MKSFKAKIIDSIGIHARPAAAIVKVAGKFESNISIKLLENDKIANAKSVINLMSLGAKKDNKLEVVITGSDEDNAFDEVKQVMIENKLIELI